MEVLVSMTVLVILLVLLTQLTGTLRGVISRTTSGIEEFRGARDAFEVMTRRIAQATLNSYDDLNPALSGTTGTTSGANSYVRASELRFISGDAGSLLTGQYTVANSSTSTTSTFSAGSTYPGSNAPYPTDAIFFQAPLGFSQTQNASLTQLLNTCGYFIQWGSDQLLRPSFLPASIPYRWRFRLMEVVEPSEKLRIYNNGQGGTSGPSSYLSTRSAAWDYASTDWFQYPALTEAPSPVHVLAENIIFLALLPMVAPQNASPSANPGPDGTSIDLAPGYFYDTTPNLVLPTGQAPISSSLSQKNQLPPMLYVMMIAVEEKSFARYQAMAGTTPPNLGLVGILTNSSYATRQSDVANVTTQLTNNKIGYRIFSIAVPLGAH